MMETNSKLAQLLENLVVRWSCWDEYGEYYIELAIKLAANPDVADFTWEKQLFREIKQELAPGDLNNLGKYLQQSLSAVQYAEKKRREAAHRREQARKREQAHAEKKRQEAAYRRSLARRREQERVEKERQERLRQLERERRERARRENEKHGLLKDLKEHFEQDFLNAERFYQDRCTNHISFKEYETEKINFVQSWADTNDIDPKPDRDQAAAIGAMEGNIQVVARAGSGKTATLVNRALFLQQHCGVSPDEMLLLAFNKKAAEEMRERFTAKLQDSIPHVMTFHALAYALVHPEELLHDEPEGEQSQSRTIQDDVIDDFLVDRDYSDAIRAVMMAHFRADWERIDSGGYNLPQEEVLRYRRSLPRETLDGKYVKSYGEKVIANFLFEHGIKYRYERNFWWNDVNYRPDFTVFTGSNRGVVVEYFGLKGCPDYDAMSEEKRNYWSNKPDWKLLEFFPHDLPYNGEGGFLASLKQQLEDCGIRCNRLSEEEIWNRTKRRAISRFTTVIKRFIQRCRQLSLTSEQVVERVNDQDCSSDVEEQFLSLAHTFYESYLKRLQASGEEDFDGLMQQAAERVTIGQTKFQRKLGDGDLRRIRYMLIDEYQDFSELFFRLVEAIRIQNPQARFFCVGDNWQAINGFAGSDLRFFQDFAQYFSDSRKLHVTTNYRSVKSIVDAGNQLMRGLGKPARTDEATTGNVILADLATFEPTLREEQDNAGDILTPAVLRLVTKVIDNNKNVVLLARKNNLPWYVNYKNKDDSPIESGLSRFLTMVRIYLPERHKEKVTASTVHKYKGLEQTVVIVLDAVDRSFPLIHPDLIFTRIFGDSVESVIAEERRLFYVALTRAVESVYILTETRNLSPFLEDIELTKLNWSDYPPVVGPTKFFTIRVGNQRGRGTNPTFQIKDLLRAERYDWKQKFTAWCTVRSSEGFSVKEFFGQSIWTDSADGIEVQFYDDFENEVAAYHVDEGKWTHARGKILEPADNSNLK